MSWVLTRSPGLGEGTLSDPTILQNPKFPRGLSGLTVILDQLEFMNRFHKTHRVDLGARGPFLMCALPFWRSPVTGFLAAEEGSSVWFAEGRCHAQDLSVAISELPRWHDVCSLWHLE